MGEAQDRQAAIWASQALDALTFPLSPGIRFIEASAGTGKTWTIAALYLRLVLERQLSPEQILVVTFTNAAAAELRTRIRSRLTQAARFFRGLAVPEPEAQWLRQWCAHQGRPTDDAALALRLEAAAQAMDGAAIHTIHAWCRRVLVEEGWFGTWGRLPELAPMRPLREAAAQDFWRTHIATAQPLVAALAHELWGGPGGLLEECAKWWRTSSQTGNASPPAGEAEQTIAIENGSSSTPPVSVELTLEDETLQNLARKLAAAKAAWREVSAELRQHFHAAIAADETGTQRTLKNTRARPDRATIERVWARFDAWAQSETALAPEPVEEYVQGKKTKAGESLLKNIWEGKWRTSEPFLKGKAPGWAQEARWDEVFTTIGAAQQALQQARQTWQERWLPAIARWIEARTRQLARQSYRCGFDELLSEMHAALTGAGGDRLAQRLRSRYPAVLIDEFQDTDALQAQIFARWCRDAVLWVMIGDPKQSIYAFRGADLNVYVQLRATAQTIATLPTNYRSSRAMVAAVNALLGWGQARCPDGAFARREIPFEQVEANGLATSLIIAGAAAAPLHLYLPELGEDKRSAEDWRAMLAEAAARTIAHWLARGARAEAGFLAEDGGFQPLAAHDIAVLVRDRYEAEAMKAALQRYRVPAVFWSEETSVLASIEALDLWRWLVALLRPEDEAAVRAAVASATMARRQEELMQWLTDEAAWDEVMARFAAYAQAWRRSGVLAALWQLLHEEDVPARLLAMPEGERRLTNVLHLIEWLQRLAHEVPGEMALLRALAQAIAEGGVGSGDEHLLRLDGDAARVRIVTLHKAKGLEFALVVLPFATWPAKAEQERGASPPTSAERGTAPDGAAVGDEGKGGDRHADDAWRENLRLWYVGLTRAKHLTWLGLAPVENQNGNWRDSAVGWWLTGGREGESSGQALAASVQAFAQHANDEAVRIWGEAGDQLVAVPSATEIPEPPAEPEASTVPSSDRLIVRPLPPAPRRWWIASYSALVAGRDTEALMDRLAEGALAGESKQGLVSSALFESTNSPLDAPAAALAALRHDPPVMPPTSNAFAWRGIPNSVASPAVPARAEGEMQAARARILPPVVPSVAPTAASLRRLPDELPPGAASGTVVHELLRWVGERGFFAGMSAAAWHPQALTEARRWLRRHRLEESLAPALVEWLSAFLALPLTLPDGERVRLGELETLACEWRFLVPAESGPIPVAALDAAIQAAVLPGRRRAPLKAETLNGFVQGFVDLVFAYRGRYYLLDYKTNVLQPDPDAYRRDALADAVLAHRYDAQLALYSLAWWRQMQVVRPSQTLGDAAPEPSGEGAQTKARPNAAGSGQDPGEIGAFGGAMVLFVRACDGDAHGVFGWQPDGEALAALDRLLAQGTSDAG